MVLHKGSFLPQSPQSSANAPLHPFPTNEACPVSRLPRSCRLSAFLHPSVGKRPGTFSALPLFHIPSEYIFSPRRISLPLHSKDARYSNSYHFSNWNTLFSSPGSRRNSNHRIPGSPHASPVFYNRIPAPCFPLRPSRRPEKYYTPRLPPNRFPSYPPPSLYKPALPAQTPPNIFYQAKTLFCFPQLPSLPHKSSRLTRKEKRFALPIQPPYDMPYINKRIMQTRYSFFSFQPPCSLCFWQKKCLYFGLSYLE